jgi:serine/threonine protein kinase
MNPSKVKKALIQNAFTGKMKLVGQGQYGRVYSMTYRPTNTMCAVKVLNSADAPPEITAFRRLQGHPHIMKLYAVLVVEDSHLFVMEHCASSLHDFIKRHGGTLSADIVFSELSQLMNGLSYMHANFLVHCDITPSNVLHTYEGEIKITDFGLVQVAKPDPETGAPICTNDDGLELVTLFWRPPELILGAKAFDGRVDTWSAGCIGCQLITGGTSPFASNCEIGVLFQQYRRLGSPSADSSLDSLPYYSEHHPRFKVPEDMIDEPLIRERLTRTACEPLLSCLILDPARRATSLQAARAFLEVSRKETYGSPSTTSTAYSSGSPGSSSHASHESTTIFHTN